MKSAEYITALIMHTAMSAVDKQQLIKEYAKQCAQQALNDAVEKSGNNTLVSRDIGKYQRIIMPIVKRNILKTEIKTP